MTKVAIPNSSTPFVNPDTGIITYQWQLYLVGVGGGSPGSSAAQVAVGASPFVYTVPSSGLVVVSSGTLALSRDGGATYLPITGNSVPVRNADLVQLTYTGGAPSFNFLPD